MPGAAQLRADALSVIGQFSSGESDGSEAHDRHLAKAFSQAADA
jgi:hypothetical protein